jgi:hypothetical protein
MIGPNGGQDLVHCDRAHWGLLPRAAEFLLGYLNSKATEGVLSYEVKASFLQIYNENLYDLLRDSGPNIDDHLAKDQVDLKIREAPKPKSLSAFAKGNSNEIYVAGLSEFRVQTSDDILHILTVGTNNRMTRSTDFNLTSSRSHALLQLTFEIEQQVDSGQTLISRSKLNLIDLAGSEKVPYQPLELSNTKQHMKELTAINKSLSALGNVIAALSSSSRSHIPYRDAKLTRILQDSLGGNTRTILIACVAPTVLHCIESLSTLQFADRAKNVRITVKANTVVDDKVTLAKAQAEIHRLKALLARTMKQLDLKNTGGVSSDGDDCAPIDRILHDNEELRRENDSLRQLAMNRNLLDSDLRARFPPSQSVDALTSPRAHRRFPRSMSHDTDDASSVGSARKGMKAAKLGFNSCVDRFGNRILDEESKLNSKKKEPLPVRRTSQSSNPTGKTKSLLMAVL